MNPPFDMEHRLSEIDSSLDSRLECIQRLLTSSPTEESGRPLERVKQLRSAIECINSHGTSHTSRANLHDRVELLRSQCDQLEMDAITIYHHHARRLSVTPSAKLLATGRTEYHPNYTSRQQTHELVKQEHLVCEREKDIHARMNDGRKQKQLHMINTMTLKVEETANGTPVPPQIAVSLSHWPQLPISHMKNETKSFKRIEEWRNKPLVNNRGSKPKPSQIVYGICANADHRNAYHAFPSDVASLLRTQLACIYYLRSVRKFHGLDWNPANKYERVTEDGGEYLVYESRALPFYLQMIFDQQYDLFSISPWSLLTISVIVDQLIWWSLKRSENRPLPAEPMTHDNITFDAHLESLCDLAPVETYDPSHSSPKPLEVYRCYQHIKESEICVIPSVLLFNKKRTANEWYDGLRLLEREANVTVFPFIEVESEMENKDRYLQHIMKSPNYIPLDKKLELGDAYIPPSMPKAASSFSPSGIEIWNGFQYSITRGSNLLAPTVLIHTDELPNKESELLLFLSHLLQLLQSEINEFGWKAEEGVWIIKGTNSTRTNVLKRFRTVKEALTVIKEASQQGMKLCAAQPGFIIQPSMKGLDWEARTYFRQDEALFTLINDQALLRRQTFVHFEQDNKEMENGSANGQKVGCDSEDMQKEQSTSAFRMYDVRGFHRIEAQEYFQIRPQIIDFSIHILRSVQSHCQLVSSSPILRVDIGIEIELCQPGQSEESCRSHQKRSEDWQLTGRGFIIRCFLNEVTSTLDINWFSIQTTYPIMWTASYATAQHLLDIIYHRQHSESDSNRNDLKSPQLLRNETELFSLLPETQRLFDIHFEDILVSQPRQLVAAVDSQADVKAEVEAETRLLQQYEEHAEQLMGAREAHQIDANSATIGQSPI